MIPCLHSHDPPPSLRYCQASAAVLADPAPDGLQLRLPDRKDVGRIRRVGEHEVYVVRPLSGREGGVEGGPI